MSDQTPIGEAIQSWLRANPGKARSQAALARAVGVHGSRISQIISGHSPATTDLAKRIHHFTDGGIPGSLLRPDVWPSPELVPDEAIR